MIDWIGGWTFWVSVLLIVYAYFGYPLCLIALSLFRNRPVRKGDITPRVSFIITAYNEEKRLRAKLENTLALDYPRELLEIIVASDGSTDGTDDIVRSFEPSGVRLIRAPRREGKEAAQKLAVKFSTGEILVFTDVATSLAPGGLRSLVGNFDDPTVGCASSVDRIVDPEGKESGEGAYVRYEMFLRILESRVNSLVGLSGSFFAARREVCRDWATDLQSDFNTLFNAVRMGFRGVLDPESAGFYTIVADQRKEFDRKARTVLRGIAVVARNLSILGSVRHALFSWQVISHKILRWLVPFAMVLALAASVCLSSGSLVYLAIFHLQVTFYALAAAGFWLKGTAGFQVLKLPAYFLLVNLSILVAWWRFLKGERMVRWEPSERPV